MTATETQAEALGRARGGMSTANYSAIFSGFAAMGVPESEIVPRQNVFTYRAWQALGRQVRRGERGVSVTTWVPMTRKNRETGKREDIGRRPKTATVFHISQTDRIGGAA